MKTKVSAFIGIVATIALLIWAWQDVSFSEVLNSLHEVKIGWLILGLITFLASFTIRAYRWGTLLADQPNKGSFHLRHAAVFIGFASNQILPANAGEFVRSGILKKFAGISLSACVGSLFAARLLDAVVAFIFLFTPLLTISNINNNSLNRLPLLGLGLILLILCLSIAIAARHPKPIAHTVGTITRKIGLQRIETQMEERSLRFFSGLTIFQSWQQTAIALLQTLGIWSISGITFWATLAAFNLRAPGFTGALFVQSLEAMATIIPSTPGHLGAFEAAIRFGLSFYAIPPSTIAAYTFVLRVLMNGGVIVIGLLFAINLGLTKKDFFD